MSAIDTAREYCAIEPEAPREVAGSDPAIESWPTVGKISFSDVCLPAVTGERQSTLQLSFDFCCDISLRRTVGWSAQRFV